MRTSPISSDEVRTRCLTLLRSLLFTGTASRRTRRSLGPRFGSRNLLCPSRRPCRGLGPALWPCCLLRSRHWLGLRLLLAHLLRPLPFYRRPVLPNDGPCRLSFRPRLNPRLGRRRALLLDGRFVLLNRTRCRNLLARDRECVRRLRRRKPRSRRFSSRRPRVDHARSLQFAGPRRCANSRHAVVRSFEQARAAARPRCLAPNNSRPAPRPKTNCPATRDSQVLAPAADHRSAAAAARSRQRRRERKPLPARAQARPLCRPVPWPSLRKIQSFEEFSLRSLSVG